MLLVAHASVGCAYLAVHTAETFFRLAGTFCQLLAEGKLAIFIFAGPLVHPADLAVNTTVAVLLCAECIGVGFFGEEFSSFLITTALGTSSDLAFFAAESSGV